MSAQDNKSPQFPESLMTEAKKLETVHNALSENFVQIVSPDLGADAKYYMTEALNDLNSASRNLKITYYLIKEAQRRSGT